VHATPSTFPEEQSPVSVTRLAALLLADPTKQCVVDRSHFVFSVAVQLMTTVSGAETSSPTSVLTRNRWSSGATS
jgi:hypothetical protein